METLLMQWASPASARWRCAGTAASPAAHGLRRPGVVRLGASWRDAGGAVRARLGAARAAQVSEAGTKEEAVVVGADDDGAPEVRLFVGLPEDVVASSDGRSVCRPRAVSAALRALKLLDVDGVELPVSWAVAQPAAGDSFEWAGYLAVAGMVRDAGLGLRVSLHTDGAALPGWVADAAGADPDVFFTDRSGHRREGCLSFAVDELPVIAGGRSPLEAYEAFFRSFRDAFAEFVGSTVTEVTVSLGPDGELRYPSYPPGSTGGDDYAGPGEFQCYDKYTLGRLKRHAESSGQPLWGLSGPHDGPRYDDESPEFFRENGGSWKTAYGEFFLSWYAGELLAHGDRVLAAASRSFRGGNGKPVRLSAGVPLLPHGSRAAAATAGFHGGYGPVAEMFARHGCTMNARCDAVGSSPAVEERLARIKDACEEHGTLFAAESAPLADTGVWGALLSVERTRPCQFTYQRMGAEFFSPSHWPLFVQFVRALESPEEEVHEDDLPADGGERLTVPSSSGRREAESEARQMQTV